MSIIIYTGNHLNFITIRYVNFQVQGGIVDTLNKTIHVTIYIPLIFINHFSFVVIIKTHCIPCLGTGKMDTRDIIKFPFSCFSNVNIQEASMKLEGHYPVITMDLLFSTMMLSNIVQFGRSLSCIK